MKKTLKTLLASLLVLAMMASCAMADVTLNEPGVYPVADEVVTYTAFVIPKTTIEDITANTFTYWLEEKTGVRFEWEQPPHTESTTRLNLRLTDKDQPDFYYGMNFSTTQIWDLAQQGLVMPLNDLIENEMPYLKAILGENEDIRKAITAPDGNIYAFPRTEGGLQSIATQKVHIYQPWLEKLGMDMPSTPAEFEAYLQAVKDNDLNGNGDPNDEIPLISNSGNVANIIGFLMAPFEPQPDKRLNVVDGVVTPSFLSDNYREGLKWIHSLVEKGLLSVDAFTIDSNTMKGLVSRPDEMIVGAAGGNLESSFGDMNVLTTLWEDYTAVPPLANEEGVRRTINNGNTIALNSFITTSCENPEALARWCDWWFSPEGCLVNYANLEGVHYEWVDEPSIDGRTPSIKFFVNNTSAVTDNWNATGFRYQSAETRYILTNTPEILEYHYYNESLKYMDYLPEEYIPSYMWFVDDEYDIVTLYGSEILSHVNQSRAAFITGKLDINDDAVWQAYLDEFEYLEMDAWVAAYQSAYDRMMGK